MVRKFLYFIAAIIVLVIAGAFALSIWWDDLAEIALVPDVEFTEPSPLEANAYQDPAMWFSRPGMGTKDPARWQPALSDPTMSDPTTREPESGGISTEISTKTEKAPEFAVFFVHPTSFVERSSWNAPLDDAESQRIAKIYVRGMASPFNQASEIWAPRYRQAAIGAFLRDNENAKHAIDAAYADVKQAYDFFIASVDDDTPIVLAGHSQGSLHLLRLLQEEVKGTPTAARIAGIYLVGWPISVEHDLPSLGFPACASANQAGCIMTWSSFAEPADPGSLLKTYGNSIGFDGVARGTSEILCTNPLTGAVGGSAPASANRGTLFPQDSFSTGHLSPSLVPARCDERGLLLIGEPPEIGNYVLPGNNYHVYDIPLFWANLQQDVLNRVKAQVAAAKNGSSAS